MVDFERLGEDSGGDGGVFVVLDVFDCAGEGFAASLSGEVAVGCVFKEGGGAFDGSWCGEGDCREGQENREDQMIHRGHSD